MSGFTATIGSCSTAFAALLALLAADLLADALLPLDPVALLDLAAALPAGLVLEALADRLAPDPAAFAGAALLELAAALVDEDVVALARVAVLDVFVDFAVTFGAPFWSAGRGSRSRGVLGGVGTSFTQP
jgi:hypothetical protein